MASLYKRASPQQARILRAIAGAIKNVSDAHGLEFDPRYARSVAKRATGTLTSQWRDVLAVSRMPSEEANSQPRSTVRLKPSKADRMAPPAQPGKQAKRRESQLVRFAPLRRVEKDLFSQLAALKNAGLTDRAEAFIYVLRLIAEIRNQA